MNSTFELRNESWNEPQGGSSWGIWERSNNEQTILYVLAVFAVFSAIICISITINYFISMKKQQKADDMLGYFRLTMSLSCILNLIATLSSTTYILWVTITEIPIFYALHDSHYMRTITTLSWHLSKVFLFYVFNGRLYYTFINSIFSYSRIIFIGLNTFVPLLLAVSLSISLPYAYLEGLSPEDRQKQSIGYNLFRVVFIILTLWLLFAFNKRLFTLLCVTGIEKPIEMDVANYDSAEDGIPSQSPSELSTSVDIMPATDTANKKKTEITKTNVDRKTDEKSDLFLGILIKHSILWIIVIIGNGMVGIVYSFGLHEWFVFNDKGSNEVSISFALIIQGIDAWINSLCILLSCSFGSIFYDFLCKCRNEGDDKGKGCHGWCQLLCLACVRKCT